MEKQMKEWMTAGEIAELKIRGLPHSGTGVRFYLQNKGAHLDPTLRRRRKGASGFEYHRSALLPAFERDEDWLTAQEIIDMALLGIPTRIDEMQAKFRREGVEDNPLIFRRNGQNRAFLYHRSILDPYIDGAYWFGAAEIVSMRLPGFPTSRSRINDFMKRRGVFGNPKLCRPRSRAGGGFEYHLDALPPEARDRVGWVRRPVHKGPGVHSRLERRPMGRLPDTFPVATRFTLDLSRPAGKRLVVRVPALSRPVADL